MKSTLTLKEFTTMRVLIVEDNAIDRKVLEFMLQEGFKEGLALESTESLSKAHELLKKEPFHAVILDLNLPDSQGQDTIVHLSEMYPHLAIVVNTGAYSDDLGIQTLSMGAQDFLIKGQYNSYTLNKAVFYAVERKRLDQQLEDTFKRLQETQMQLAHAEKLKVIGGIAMGIAHEVRNPLATITYGTAFLKNTLNNEDEQINLVLENISDASERASQIITDLLDLSSISKLDKKQDDLNEVIIKSLNMIKHEFESNRLKIELNLESNLPNIRIDRNRITQVLINVLLNAIKASKKDGKVIVSSTSKESLKNTHIDNKFVDLNNNRLVMVSIQDEGCGISKNIETQLFNPFFTTRRAEGGVGLGLSVCRNIMDLHNGLISVHNNTNAGATTVLLFPLD